MKPLTKRMFAALLLLFFTVLPALAQGQAFDVKLWLNGLPNSNGQDGGSYDISDPEYKPAMRVFLPAKDKSTGRAILCIPGGGYARTSYVNYTKTWIPFYLGHGIAVITLHYRIPKGKCEVTLSDAYEAMRMVKTYAKEWNIDPENIGIQGLSAGGHLASSLVTHAPENLRPAFQILIYPVISFDKQYDFIHQGSRDNFIGKDPVPAKKASKKEKNAYRKAQAHVDSLAVLYSNEKQVSKNDPRAFIAASDDDKLVMNSILYYSALHRKGVPAELHIYPSGGHGWHIDDGKFPYSDLVKDELLKWLSSF